MGIGAAIWWALSGIAAAFVGGWVAAHLSGVPSREAGMLHGRNVGGGDARSGRRGEGAAGDWARSGRVLTGVGDAPAAGSMEWEIALPGDAGPAAQQARAAADAAAEGASTAALS